MGHGLGILCTTCKYQETCEDHRGREVEVEEEVRFLWIFKRIKKHKEIHHVDWCSRGVVDYKKVSTMTYEEILGIWRSHD